MVAEWKHKRYMPLPLADMTREEKIEELYTCLTSLWSGGGGDYGTYTVAMERTRLHALLFDLLGERP